MTKIVATLFSLTLYCSIFSIHSAAFAQDSKKGEELYQKCVQCHGKSGEGNVEQLAPKIAGQYDWYIETQLKNFKAKVRSNPKMLPFISVLSDKDFKDLAAYVSTLK